MAVKILPDADILRQLFNYDPETGVLRHATRPRHFFPTAGSHSTWNTKWAGKLAGRIVPNGYPVISFLGYTTMLYRVAYKIHYGTEPPPVLDHINGDPLDNRIANLRHATQSQNLANTRLRSDSTTGVKGVHFDKSRQLYMAHINVDGRFRNLGRFATIQEAITVRQAAAHLYYGEFVRL